MLHSQTFSVDGHDESHSDSSSRELAIGEFRSSVLNGHERRVRYSLYLTQQCLAQLGSECGTSTEVHLLSDKITSDFKVFFSPIPRALTMTVSTFANK